MKLFASERDRQSNGRLMYYDEIGPVGPIPELSVEPNPQGTFTVSVMLLDSPNSGRWYETTVASVDSLLEAWLVDPEEVLRRVFHWPGLRRATGPPNKKVASLDDLLA